MLKENINLMALAVSSLVGMGSKINVIKLLWREPTAADAS